MDSIATGSSTGNEYEDNNLGFEFITISRVCIPDVSPKPLKGVVFLSVDQAFDFYRTYAHKSGFECKRGSAYNPNCIADPNLKYFYCSREGFKPKSKFENSIGKSVVGGEGHIGKENVDNSNIIKRNRASIRCGCKAQVRIKKIKDNMYEVYMFVEEHNHGMVNEKDRKFLKAYRDLSYTKKQFMYHISVANYRPVKGFKLMKELYGGFENIGATANDCKNFKRELSLFVGDRDAEMLIQKLKSKQEFCPGYFMDYLTDDTNTLCCLFWADGQSKRNYDAFGDIVSFDATFRSNKYKMVFVPFTGIDNHNRNVTFGGGLLSKENIVSYKWLLNCFKTAFGQDPKILVTDQDPTMKQAIPSVFPDSRHRLCMWHIMQKFTKKVGATLSGNTTFKKRVCDIVWTDKISPDVFEKEWCSIIQDFCLEANNWLSDIFDLRADWIPAFYRDEPMSGLMRTTSRSESENHFFGKLTNSELTLVEFLSHFDSAIDCQRFTHDKNDHDSSYSTPDLKTSLPIEKYAADKYTRTIFFDVQDEIYAALMSSHSISRSCVDGIQSYNILDVTNRNTNNVDVVGDEWNGNSRIFQVSFNQSDETTFGSCKRFESYGLLCRHIFYVFRMCKFNQIPHKYLLRRWSKDAISPKLVRPNVVPNELGNMSKDIEDTFRGIYRSVEDSVNRLANDISKLRLYQEKQKELLESITVEVLIPPKLNKNDLMCSLLGVSEPAADADIVKVPTDIRNKGCDSKKRIVSQAEIAIQQSEKKLRECKTSFKMVNDHDSRNCKKKQAERKVALKKQAEMEAATSRAQQ